MTGRQPLRRSSSDFSGESDVKFIFFSVFNDLDLSSRALKIRWGVFPEKNNGPSVRSLLRFQAKKSSRRVRAA